VLADSKALIIDEFKLAEQAPLIHFLLWIAYHDHPLADPFLQSHIAADAVPEAGG